MDAENFGSRLPCGLTLGPQHSVVSAIDGNTLTLEDGSTVRLAGILAPHPPGFAEPGQVWAPATAARDAISKLTIGRTITLAFVKPREDRYRRLLAHVFVDEANSDRSPLLRTWLQARLLELGHARVFTPPGQTECAQTLLAAEGRARTGVRGLWSVASYRPRSAAKTKRLLRARGTFQLVAGRVKSVAARRHRTYINFGDNWKTDFTIVVPARVLRSWPQWAGTLEALKDKDVEVRGWIDSRNGPTIELDYPSQIKILPVTNDRPMGTQPQR